jgi:hypothetical protein
MHTVERALCRVSSPKLVVRLLVRSRNLAFAVGGRLKAEDDALSSITTILFKRGKYNLSRRTSRAKSTAVPQLVRLTGFNLT